MYEEFIICLAYKDNGVFKLLKCTEAINGRWPQIVLTAWCFNPQDWSDFIYKYFSQCCTCILWLGTVIEVNLVVYIFKERLSLKDVSLIGGMSAECVTYQYMEGTLLVLDLLLRLVDRDIGLPCILHCVHCR